MGHIHPENMGDAAHVPLKVSFDAFDERVGFPDFFGGLKLGDHLMCCS